MTITIKFTSGHTRVFEKYWAINDDWYYVHLYKYIVAEPETFTRNLISELTVSFPDESI